MTSPVVAQEQRVQRGPVPAWARPSEPLAKPAELQGPVFIERQDVITRLDAKGQAQYFGYRIRILHSAALEAGNIMIAWNPASGPPVVHALAIHRDGKTIDVLETTDFEVLRREDQLERASLDGILTAVLRVPDLRVGDTLEVEFTVRRDDPTLRDASAGVLALDAIPAPGRFRMEVNWEPGQAPQIKSAPALTDIAVREADRFIIRADNPAPLSLPKDAPPRYVWQRMAEYSDFKSWAQIKAAFRPLYAEAATLAPASPVREEAARIAAAHSDPMDRARAALKLVQQQVRYVYVGLDGGNYRPASADETWRRRYGDCKAKTALLLALLRELDVPAQAVVVNNSGFDDGLDQHLPSPGLFDHVVVRSTIGGKKYWLDGTLPPVAGPSERPIIDYRWVLPLDDKSANLEAVAWTPLKTPLEMSLYEIDASKGFDVPARIVQTTVTRGIDGLGQYAQLSPLSDAQLETAFRSELTGSSSWNSIEDVSYRYDEGAAAGILTIKGVGPVDWRKDDDGERSLALPGGGFSPPGRRAREPGQDQAAPFYNKPDFDCRVTTVRLPTDVPATGWSFNSIFDTMMFGEIYYRVMQIRGQTIRMVRGYRTEEREISAAKAERDNARLPRFDNSMAWITYTPPSKEEPITIVMEPGDWPDVPATDEIDWTRADAPCLGQDLIK